MRPSCLGEEADSYCNNRYCFRKTLEIWQGLAQAQNPVSDLFVARARWSLGVLLAAKGDSWLTESESLKQEAQTFLHAKFGEDASVSLNPEVAIDSLVFYWSK